MTSLIAKESSLADLLTDIRACTRCQAALPHGVNPVLQINGGARILIAAQAPGRKVHESSVPFNDASGERLRSWMGISRETFYDPTHFADGLLLSRYRQVWRSTATRRMCARMATAITQPASQCSTDAGHWKLCPELSST